MLYFMIVQFFVNPKLIRNMISIDSLLKKCTYVLFVLFLTLWVHWKPAFLYTFTLFEDFKDTP